MTTLKTTKDIYGFKPEKDKIYILNLPDGKVEAIRYRETKFDTMFIHGETTVKLVYNDVRPNSYSAINFVVYFNKEYILEKIGNQHYVDTSKIPLKERIAIKRGTYYDN